MDTGARKRREIPIDELYRLEKSRDAHDYCGTKVRSRVVDGKTWVMFADICKVLGYKNARHQVKYIPDGEKLKVEFGLKNTTVNCVNRDGLLRTCLLSQREDTLSFSSGQKKKSLGVINVNSTEGALKPTDFHIDTSAIPREVGDCIAAATLDLIHEILRQPGGREMLDARTAARAERRAAERS